MGSVIEAMQEACGYLLTVERMFKHQNWEVRAGEARKRRLALKRAIKLYEAIGIWAPKRSGRRTFVRIRR
jgi:hypothetical protein